jgi:hypothetical protein
MRRVYRRSADARRANIIPQKPSSGIPSLSPLPDVYSSGGRSSYIGSQQMTFRSPFSSQSSLRDRFILYGKGINYPNVLRILLLMLVLFTIALVSSLYRLFT